MPVLADSFDFDRAVEAAGPAGLLLAIEARMGVTLARHMTAEDLWQETLLQAWKDRQRHEWRGLQSFRNWLLAVAMHRLHDALDRVGAQKRAGGAEPAHLAGASQSSGVGDAWALVSTTPSRIAMHRERADAMRAALELLPDRLREVVRLRVFEEEPLDRIAAQLALSHAAVKHRLREGPALYRVYLRRALPEESADRTSS